MKYEELISVMGEVTATKFCKQYGGETVYVPILPALMREKIRELWGKGLPSNVISERVGCSERHVRRVLGE